MNPRTTGLLLLAAAALGAFVYLYEVRGGEQRRDAELAEKRLFPDVKTTDVEWVALSTTDGRPARAERREGAWRLVEPLDFPGDAVNLDGIAAGLADLASETVIESPQPPAVYGLDESSRVVRFGAGGREHALRIGKKTPVGPNTYVATEAAPERIVTVPTYRVTNLERTLDDLRDRRVTSFDRGSIARIDLRWPEGGVRLLRGPDGWSLVEPVAGKADEATVDTLLSNLSYLRADGFLDEPRSDATAGLDRPALDVVLTGTAAEGAQAPTFRISFGIEENGKRLVRGAGPGLYLVPSQRLTDFARDVTSYRFKELSRFVATDAKRVVFRFPPTTDGIAFEESAEHGDAGWKGSPEPLDPGKVARLVAELARLRGTDIVKESAGEAELATLGLAPPRVRIEVFGTAAAGAAAPELAVVEIGDSTSDGPLARTPSSPAVYRLAPSVTEWLPTGVDSFRKSFVAPPAPPPAPDAAPDAEAGATPDDLPVAEPPAE